jgi:vitamin B12/bleomycin/antimicrobial peptide transport system ATP-binding/permease protein
MVNGSCSSPSRRVLVARFWSTACGFWVEEARVTAWLLTIGLIGLVLVQLAVQYRLNIWNRDLFNAIEAKHGGAVLTQALVFAPLALATVTLAVVAVYGRMKMQREWRAWVTDRLISRWLARGRYYQLSLVTGNQQVPESRIADDTRVATDAPVDFAVGIFQAVATAITFIGVLWVVGGNITIGSTEAMITIPGYLVVAAVLYSALPTTFMLLLAPRFMTISEATSQAEAEFRYALMRLRENGESVALLGGEQEEQRGLRRALATVIGRWRSYCHQHMRSTVVSNSNYLLAPTIPLILCAPKYLAGTMTLGEVTQAAAAFVQVQSAFNWLVDNYPRLSDWMASVHRVASLLRSLDHLEAVSQSGYGSIRRTEHNGSALCVRDLSITLDNGTVVVNDADVTVERNERVLVVGESGTGKSSLVRAIAGLWPWGQGEVAVPRGARLFLMPQQPYIPLGSLRRVAMYPLPSSAVTEHQLRDVMEFVGLAHLVNRLDVESSWEHILSSGEKQRIAFVRLLLHRPDLVVMDEATSALDPASQEQLMNLVVKALPGAAIISIAHRPELEAFHHRKLVFEHRPGGSRLVSDKYSGSCAASYLRTHNPVAAAPAVVHFVPSVAPLAHTKPTSTSSSPHCTVSVPMTTRMAGAGPGSPFRPGSPFGP